VLDLGVGDGRNAIPLAQQGFEVTGLDIHDHDLNLLKQHAHEAGVRIRSVHAIANYVPDWPMTSSCPLRLYSCCPPSKSKRRSHACSNQGWEMLEFEETLQPGETKVPESDVWLFDPAVCLIARKPK